MEKFKTVAKLTQRIYGRSNNAASLETRKKLNIVRSIAVHKGMMTINPLKGDLRPKNANDQRAFNTSWIRKTNRLSRTW
jgi:hypothetical protein